MYHDVRAITMESPENDPDKKPGFNWASLLQSFQRLRYTSPVGMLTLAIVAIAVVFGLMAWRTEKLAEPVQITLIIGIAAVAVTFFWAVVRVITRLGAYASLSGTQVTDYARVELGIKGVSSVPSTPTIAGESAREISEGQSG